MRKISVGSFVRHMDGRTGLVQGLSGGPELPLATVRFGRQTKDGQEAGQDETIPLGYIELVGSKDMD